MDQLRDTYAIAPVPSSREPHFYNDSPSRPWVPQQEASPRRWNAAPNGRCASKHRNIRREITCGCELKRELAAVSDLFIQISAILFPLQETRHFSKTDIRRAPAAQQSLQNSASPGRHRDAVPFDNHHNGGVAKWEGTGLINRRLSRFDSCPRYQFPPPGSDPDLTIRASFDRFISIAGRLRTWKVS